MGRTYCKSINYGTVSFLNNAKAKPTALKFTSKKEKKSPFEDLFTDDSLTRKVDKISKPRKGAKIKKKKTGSKKKKARTVFADSDNSSDFISCNSDSEKSTDFSFSFKHKSEEKENTFDKLFDNGIKRDPNRPIFADSLNSSSVNYHSGKISTSEKVGLFQSITAEDSPLKMTKRKTATKATTVKDQTKKVTSRRPRLKVSKDPERCFSDQTLDYITNKFSGSVIVSETKLGLSGSNRGLPPLNNHCAAVSVPRLSIDISPVKNMTRPVCLISLVDVDSPATSGGIMTTSTPSLNSLPAQRPAQPCQEGSSPSFRSEAKCSSVNCIAEAISSKHYNSSVEMFVEEKVASGNLAASKSNFATSQPSLVNMGRESVDLFADFAEDGDQSKLINSLSIVQLARLNQGSGDLFSFEDQVPQDRPSSQEDLLAPNVLVENTTDLVMKRSTHSEMFQALIKKPLKTPNLILKRIDDDEVGQNSSMKTADTRAPKKVSNFDASSAACNNLLDISNIFDPTKSRQSNLSRKTSLVKPGKQKYFQRRSVMVVEQKKTLATSTPVRRPSFVAKKRRHSSQLFAIPQLIKLQIQEENLINESDEEKDAASPMAKTRLNSSRRGHLGLSSSYIVTEDGDLTSSQEKDLVVCDVVNVVEKVLARCRQNQIVALSDLYPEEIIRISKKVGEGAFGEVFLLNTDSAPVLKIVPVDGSALVNGQPQTKLSDMLAEIVISTELSDLGNRESHAENCAGNFVEVRKCVLTSGEYPESLLELWDKYDNEKVSENDRPDCNLFGGQEEKQKFVVLEFGNGGQDLEHVTLKNAAQGLAVFHQVAHALAVAENCFEFEHRDLHWGNILVRECSENFQQYILDGQTLKVESQSVCVTIIDFSLSRMKSPKDGCRIFNNLAEDEELFVSQGDYQFEIYRLMRDHTGNEWQGFYPKTNIMWLHYLADKLIGEVNYKSKKSKVHTASLACLKQLKNKVLDFSSTKHFVTDHLQL